MLFGLLLFASFPKLAWSSPDTYVLPTLSWTTHFDSSESIRAPEAAVRNQKRLNISDITDTPSFSWLPTREDIWTNNGESLTFTTSDEVHYALWNENSIRLLLPHDCPDNQPIHWQTIRHKGSISATEFTTLTIPRIPYSQSINIKWTCGTSTSIQSTTITTDNSLPIPHIQWRWLNAQTLRVVSLDATGSTLSIVHEDSKDKWNIHDTAFLTHPLSVLDVNVPSIDTHLKLELSTQQTVLYRSPPISVRNTEMSVTQPNDQTYSIDVSSTAPSRIVYNQLIGHNTSVSSTPTPSVTQNPIVDRRLMKGLYWLSLQDTSRQQSTVEPLWTYEGVWTWYKDIQWTTTHQSPPETKTLRSSTPPYIRWGDALVIPTRYLDDSNLEEHIKWIIGDPLHHNLPISPEDGLFYNHGDLSIFKRQLTNRLTPPAKESLPFLFRTDSQASDAHLLTLLPFLKENSLMSSATLLHHGSLLWDALHTRNLSWYNQVLDTIYKALRRLENLSDAQWNTLDFEVQLYIVWANLIADKEGLSPNSAVMRRNLTWLCSLSDTDIELDRALISHVRWLVTQSYWKHRSCTGSAQPLSTHPLTTHTVQSISAKLNTALREHRTYTLERNAPLWQQWIFYEQEKEFRDRYVNLALFLKDNKNTVHGLFHEWQINPIQALLTNSEATFRVSGVGRLYTSTWQPWVQSLDAQEGKTIQVTRTLTHENNTVVNPTQLHIGMPIQIHTNVQGLPNTTFCIRRWGSAGLADQSLETHKCHTLNEQGHWSKIENTHVVYDGQYRLPATWVATQTDLAHTATTWLRTKRLMYP